MNKFYLFLASRPHSYYSSLDKLHDETLGNSTITDNLFLKGTKVDSRLMYQVPLPLAFLSKHHQRLVINTGVIRLIQKPHRIDGRYMQVIRRIILTGIYQLILKLTDIDLILIIDIKLEQFLPLEIVSINLFLNQL